MTIVKTLAATVLHAGAYQPHREGPMHSKATPVTSASPTKPLAPMPSPPPPSPPIARPGCTVADETLTVKGHLEGLAKGWGGFGVLRTSKVRLDNAILAARSVKANTIAQHLGQINSKLPTIHSQVEAKQILKEMEPLIPQVWRLGMMCKGSTEILEKAQELSQQIKQGGLTKAEAVEKLKEAIQ